MRALTLSLLLAGCYDTRLLDGRPAPVDVRDASVADVDLADVSVADASTADASAADAAPACGPDGTAPDPSQPLVVCCAGTPTRIDTPDHCGACGTRCAAGHDCHASHGGYYCGCLHDADCGAGCCSAAWGVPWVCSTTCF